MPRTRTTRRAAVLALAAATALAAAGPAQAESVIAIGTGQQAVTAAKPRNESSIRAAVFAARRDAIPRALLNARVQAALIGDASGLRIGAITAVEEQLGGVFSPYFYSRFGPNRFCGEVNRALVRRVDGTRVVRRVKRRQCSVPPFVTVSLSVTFAAAPGPVVVTATP